VSFFPIELFFSSLSKKDFPPNGCLCPRRVVPVELSQAPNLLGKKESKRKRECSVVEENLKSTV